MIVYITIILSLILFVVAGLIWLRKAQYDAIHRNFLDLVDQYGGRVVRDAFAIRPKFMGKFMDTTVTVSFSSEKKDKNKSRQYYISIFLQANSIINFSILSMDWLSKEGQNKLGDRIVKNIFDQKYLIEVSDKELMKNLNSKAIETMVSRMHPFAYALVTKKGIILERLSQNLIEDTEFTQINELLEALYGLTKISPQ
ncbi:MAG: hypothetical protein JSW33_07330 [bacterium]|nr:MAG: hypothetical protein JSW33_07330 [bacterium]